VSFNETVLTSRGVDTALINKMIKILIDFIFLTKDYIIGIANLFSLDTAPLGVIIIAIALIYTIINGLAKSWKILVGAIIVAIIISLRVG